MNHQTSGVPGVCSRFISQLFLPQLSLLSLRFRLTSSEVPNKKDPFLCQHMFGPVYVFFHLQFHWKSLRYTIFLYVVYFSSIHVSGQSCAPKILFLKKLLVLIQPCKHYIMYMCIPSLQRDIL